MHATIRRYEGVDTRSLDELFQKDNDEFVPLVGQLPGFIGYYALDAGNGVVASVSIFETKQQAEECNRAAADWVGDALADIVRNPPTVTTGEIKATTATRAGVR